MVVTGNPPRWAERLMKRYWGRLANVAGAGRLPSGPGAEEYGCGHYGCVWPTPGKQVVKLTSDLTEASVVAAFLRMGNVEGIVRYHGIYRLPGAKHRNREVFVLWRDEAWEVGGLSALQGFGYHPGPPDPAERHRRRVAQTAVKYIESFVLHARKVKSYLDSVARKKGPEAAVRVGQEAWEMHGKQPSWSRGSMATEWRKTGHYGDQLKFNASASSGLRGPAKPAVHLAACAHLALEMSTSVELLGMIGGAMERTLERGILLADVHLNNIGKIEYDPQYAPGDLAWGITDPGHAVFLSPEWSDLFIPDLP